ncbi:MAG: amidase [Geminicoccaceae bacterium]
MALDRLDKATMDDIARALEQRTVSSRELVEAHTARVSEQDARLGAVIELNPDAIVIAGQRDAERAAGRLRGPLHGMPLMVKDNLDTGDRMRTSAGSLALAGHRAAADSHVVHRLRAAGAVILGKTNLSEWANFRSTRSTSGWSSRGGQTRNPYDTARTPGGSSSGSAVAVAAGFCAGAIGTETDGSILHPCSMTGLVGIKPTVGLVSRSGIIPIAASQDTAGPMARTVADAALLLGAIAGTDPGDPATAAADGQRQEYRAALDPAGLGGVRLGVARAYCGYHERADRLLEDAIGELEKTGAMVIDPIELPSADEIRPAERLVMETEFKQGLQAYLAAADTGLRDLGDVIAFNRAHAATVMPHFGQEILEASLERGGLDDPSYLDALATCRRLARTEGIDAALARDGLDAIIAPTTTPAWLIDWLCGDNKRGGASCPAAVAGYPHITVPMGWVDHLPVGLSFFAGAFAESKLIRIGFAFEQRTRHHRPPAL